MKLHKKIDIYTRRKFAPRGCSIVWEYAATTEQAKTCKQAKKRFCEIYKLDETQVKTCFRK